MGCFAAILALVSPRLALFFVWIFSGWLGSAFEGWAVPLLGFVLLPWTTLAYAAMWVYGRNGVTGFEWFLVVLAFLFDLTAYRGGRQARSSRSAC